MHHTKGERVGSFEAPTSRGTSIGSEALRGTPYIAYFYPKSFTSGCTVETQGFATFYSTFQDLGVEVVGVSPDPLETQCRFAAAHGAEFPIVDDTAGEVAAAFGLKRRPIIGGYKRLTFVVDERGVIERVIDVGRGWATHPREMLDYMRSTGRA